jgi:hypothetical protein
VRVLGFIGRFLGRLLLGWTLVIFYCILFYLITQDFTSNDPMGTYFVVWLIVGLLLLKFSPMKYANPLKAIIRDFADGDDGDF